MKIILTIILAMAIFIPASAYKYTYSFSNLPVGEALLRICKDHPEVNISFIYKELDNYRTSADIRTDDTYEALRQTVALNPVTVAESNGNYYVEALQQGIFRYTGRCIARDGEPVAAATVMLLAPKDSVVITYGITDGAGRFTIPCDRKEVIAKVTSLGYKPLYRKYTTFNMGEVILTEMPINLKTITVEADDATMYNDRTVYRPTQRQKNASQTATDLLAHMAIPQLDVRLGSSNVSTISGQPVALYIDYVPATTNDLKMMRMADVKSVEYFEYPVDPRFAGNRHVVNFIMTKYEYGGYVKALGTENFIANSGSMQSNARLVRGKMTYDIMGYGYYLNNNNFGTDQTETFRLPQENGETRIFTRHTETEASRYRRHDYQASFKALYAAEKITANSQISFDLDKTPKRLDRGSAVYSDNVTDPSFYESASRHKAKNIDYTGFYYFGLPHDNSLTAQLSYSFSHTDQSSGYAETDLAPILNSANDDTHSGDARLTYSHTLNKEHSIMAYILGLYEHSRTDYDGSVDALDNSITKYGQLSASYSFRREAFSASLGLGWSFLSTSLNSKDAFSNYPYVDVSLGYRPGQKSSVGIDFHHSTWPPSQNYKSANLIHVSPFMWHTGNPLLKAHKSYDISAYYTFLPSKKLRMSAYTGAWLVGNRSAFVYEATPDGIVRTIRQPIGTMNHFTYGMNVSSSLFGGKLSLFGKLEHLLVHNGNPYNINHSQLSYYLQALYYPGQFYFSVSYQSASATDNYDEMTGVWEKKKDTFTIQAGWSNSVWNIRLSCVNLPRWNWRSTLQTMKSEYYSYRRWTSNASSHAFVQLSATYTFGFGKKVNQGDDITRKGGASSGILK